MRNIIFGIIFIAVCAFSIIQSKRSMAERGLNTEVSLAASRAPRIVASETKEGCYFIDEKEYCGKEAQAKMDSINKAAKDDPSVQEGIGQNKTKPSKERYY